MIKLRALALKRIETKHAAKQLANVFEIWSNSSSTAAQVHSRALPLSDQSNSGDNEDDNDDDDDDDDDDDTNDKDREKEKAKVAKSKVDNDISPKKMIVRSSASTGDYDLEEFAVWMADLHDASEVEFVTMLPRTLRKLRLTMIDEGVHLESILV